jgi:Domain of unknown function (DUF4105)
LVVVGFGLSRGADSGYVRDCRKIVAAGAKGPSMFRYLKHPPIGVLVAVILLLVIGAVAKPARNDRAWYPYLARTTQVDLTDAAFAVKPVTDWRYDSNDAVSKNYIDAAHDFSQLKKVWFVLEPQPGSKLAAHTFLLFEFEGDRLLGATIEARRETYEDYSAWDGLWNKYELAYLWGTAHDLLARRAVMLDHQLFMYPIKVSDAGERSVLRQMLERTHALETNPRYYNTLSSNCTNELAKATKLKWDSSFILTGTSDNHLFKLGLIPGESFAAAEQRGDVTAFVKAENGADKFDSVLLTELRKRWGKDAE